MKSKYREYDKAWYILIAFLMAFYLLMAWASRQDGIVEKKSDGKEPTYASIDMESQYLYAIINEWKYQNDGYRYEQSELLCHYADFRVDEVKYDWSRDGFRRISSKMRSDGTYEAVAENLANGFDNESEMLEAWLDSPSHKRNLTQNYTETCVRCNGGYCVQLFGK